MKNDEVESRCNHAEEHQHRIIIDRDELRDLELHDQEYLSMPAAWRWKRLQRTSSSSIVEVAASISTAEALSQLQLGTRSSKTALEKLSLAASGLAQAPPSARREPMLTRPL